jgi:DNA-directed RNA polymerase subunit N (RpoN/RPB10)
MEINSIVTIISSLGFPIVACIACGFFIKYMFETFLKQIQDMREEHRSEVDKMTKAINNNTAVIQRLLDKEKEDAA